MILGGFFGRPLQIPPNVASGDYLARLLPGAATSKRYFDGVALHPYVADARAMGAQLDNLRRIMRLHGDAATPIYVTELGWGSQQRPDPLGARPLRPGEPALACLRDALRQPPALADRRRLVVHLDRRRRQLPVLPLGRPADREARGEAGLVPLQRLDRRRSRHGPAGALRRRGRRARAERSAERRAE